MGRLLKIPGAKEIVRIGETLLIRGDCLTILPHLAGRYDAIVSDQPHGIGYLLKEKFQQLWEYESPAWAGKFLDQWCTKAMRSRIDPLKKFARTVCVHRDLLLNYFCARKAFSSGIIEGLNNKAKVAMRKSYGFRTFKVAELSLLHVLGQLPEPQLTHDFY